MPRMPTFEEIAADFARGVRTAEQRIEHPFHHDADAAHETPAEAPATMAVATAAAATPQEELMSLLDTIKNDIAEVEAKLQGADEEVLGWVNAVSANPEAKAVLSDLAGLASVVGLPVGTIEGVAKGIKTVLSLYPAETALAADPAQAAAQAVPAQQ